MSELCSLQRELWQSFGQCLDANDAVQPSVQVLADRHGQVSEGSRHRDREDSHSDLSVQPLVLGNTDTGPHGGFDWFGTLEMGVLYSKIPESIKKEIIDPYISIKDNEAASVDFTEGSNSYIKLVTTNSSEKVVIGQDTTFADDVSLLSDAAVLNLY